ncbi:hypothetical protein ACP70R_018268 [Stipagrostis hirtigluma subsp. patula]
MSRVFPRRRGPCAPFFCSSPPFRGRIVASVASPVPCVGPASSPLRACPADAPPPTRRGQRGSADAKAGAPRPTHPRRLAQAATPRRVSPAAATRPRRVSQADLPPRSRPGQRPPRRPRLGNLFPLCLMDAEGYFTSLLNEGITTQSTDPFSSPTEPFSGPTDEPDCPNVEKTPSGRPNHKRLTGLQDFTGGDSLHLRRQLRAVPTA